METDKKSWQNKLGSIFSLLFVTILFLFLAFLLLNQKYPKFIGAYIDISWFLLFIIIFGMLSLVFPTKYIKNAEKQAVSREFILTVLLGTLVGYNVFLKLEGTGFLGIYLSIISGIVVIGISALIIFRRKHNNPE